MQFDRGNNSDILRHRKSDQMLRNQYEQRFVVERKIEFTSSRKRMSILVVDPQDNHYKLLVKGADSEI